MGRRIIRLQGERLLIAVHGAVKIALAFEGVAQIDVGIDQFRLNSNRLA